MNEPRWIMEQQLKFGNMNKRAEAHGLPIEASQYQDLPISNYEKQNGVPYIVDKLQIRNEFMFDPFVRTKARSTEEFILEESERDSKVSYETILERLLARLPDSLERMIQNKNNLKVLELLFGQISILKGLSNETYLKIASNKFKSKRVEHLLSQLRQLVAT